MSTHGSPPDFSKLSVRDVLAYHLTDIKYDSHFSKTLHDFQIKYLNSNKEYIEFFSSNLFGVHVVRFTSTNVLNFYTNVLDVIYSDLEEDIRKTKTINHEYEVSGDVMNLTLIYMIHKALTLKTTPKQLSFRIAFDLGAIFFYRTIAVYMSRWVKYPVDPKIAQATYASLSNKFLIKQLGSWQKVVEYRVNDLIGDESNNYKRLRALSSDDDLVQITNDVVNRIRDMILKYYREFVNTHARGDRIGVSASTIVDVEGKEVVKDQIKHVDSAITGMKGYLLDEKSLIKTELVRIVININTNTSMRTLTELLEWLSRNYSGTHFKLIDRWIEHVVIHSFYLMDNQIESNKLKDIPYVLVQLKNLYLSTRSNDKDLNEIRDIGDKIVNLYDKQLLDQHRLSSRTALILYIALRAIVGDR